MSYCYQIYSLNLYRFSESRVAVYLNQHYPELEASTDLLLATGSELTTLQTLQRSQVYHKLQSLEGDVRFPHRIVVATIIFIVGIGSWFTANQYSTSYQSTVTNHQSSNSSPSKQVEPQAPVIPKLSKLTVTIISPAYTQIRSTESNDPRLKVVEGSSAAWEIAFSGKAVNPTIIFSGKDSITLQQKNELYQLQRTLTEGGFYQLSWKDESGKSYQTDYYPIEVTKDEGPRIEVQNLAQFVELKLTDRLVVDLNAKPMKDAWL